MRADRLAKYTPASCSVRLRKQNARRSKARLVNGAVLADPVLADPVLAACADTNSWARCGMTARADGPQQDGS